MGKYTDLLKRLDFQAFLWTQFLGAFNDNVYKIVLSMLVVNTGLQSGHAGSQISLVGAIFILPFLLFSGYAGHLADAFSKRTILVVTKMLEIVAMGLTFIVFLSGQIPFMLGVLFLMALQSTLFSPAKYGILPEILPDKDLSRANGLLEMSTFLAIILGTSVGGILFAAWKERLGRLSLVLVTLAIVGTVTSLGIQKVPAAGTPKPFSLNPWSEIGKGLQRLFPNRVLWLTVLGMSYFWFLGALLQMNLILLGKEVMGLSDLQVGILGTFLAVGIGLGSLASGRLSGDKVELGLVPLGSIGMGLFSFLLSSSAASYARTAFNLVLLGFASGLFIVPLNALLQQKSGNEEKGRIMATANFMSTLGILVASGVLWVLHDLFHVHPDRIIFIFGFVTLAVTAYLLLILPDFLIRFSLWMLTHTIYRIRIKGQEHIPFRGPALLVCNHVSHVDGLLVSACIQRFIRFLIYRPYYELKALNGFFRLMKAIPIESGNLKGIARALQRARTELEQGHLVCIFAEGAISRTGNMMPFKRGFERIVQGLEMPIIPVHLDRLWGSIFSFKDGKFFYKWPECLPYPVTVSFGSPMQSTAKTWQVRQAIMEMGSDAVQDRRVPTDLLHFRFMRTAKRCWSSLAVADSTGKVLTYGKTLIGSLILARTVFKEKPNEKMVGIMLPASVAGVLSNIAALIAGKVPINLNFTAGREAMESAMAQCHIQRIITSRFFLEKAKIQPLPGMIFLDEVMKQITPFQKAWTGLIAFLLPVGLLQRIFCSGSLDPHQLATVLFSSGSTGVPKGVMLSHHNILSNVEGLEQLFWVTEQDRIMGILPFFHSFGFTGTLWFPLISGFGVTYHTNPMDAQKIGAMVAQYQSTILISTPTFCMGYLRKCTASDFSSLRYAIVGAEKLREPLAQAFKEKYGLDLLEGYGCTEMGPVVSVNVPDVTHGTTHQEGRKAHTVGHPIPGVSVKVVAPETGDILPPGTEGLLLVRGGNRMVGYLGQPQKSEEVLREGWYVTGDIAKIDDDGFIQITDRLARFSKIGGEMVPHIKIEEAIQEKLSDQTCVVTAVPDERRGEQLVVLYTDRDIPPEILLDHLNQTDLPKLWIPKRENFFYIEAIPTLGTGKVDLKTVKEMATRLIKKDEG